MPKITTIEESNGCDLLMDNGADTCCAGKHTYVLAIIEGISVSCRGVSDNLPVEENLPVVNVIYAYDCKKRGEVILLQLNHYIYLGDKKNDAIACPNQLRLFGIHVDERPAALFPNETNVQCIIANGLKLDLETKGPLTFLPVRRLTKRELNNSDLNLIMLTSPHGWDPYNVDSSRILTDLNGCDPYHVNYLRTITT